MPIGYVGFDVSSDHPALFQEEIKQIKETASKTVSFWRGLTDPTDPFIV